VPVTRDDPTWGDRAAPATLVMFADYQCPFSARVQTTIEELKTSYGPTKLRIVWKNLPLAFHKEARLAAEAAMGVFKVAGNDAFWKFHSIAFANQQSLGFDAFVAWAVRAGVTDEAAFRRGLESHKWAPKVDDDVSLAKHVGINGTPSFMINGIELSGAQPIEKFRATLDAELAKAQRAIQDGTRPDHVYVLMSALNRLNAPPPAPPEKHEEEDDRTVWKVPIGAAPIRGSNGALVTLVEFADFQCPFSKRAQDTLKRVRDTYGDKVRIAFRNEPLAFHVRAEPAHELAMFALQKKGQAGFWAAHDKIFESQPKLDDSDLESIAKGLGLDPAQALRAVHDRSFKNAIYADGELADDLKANGTPTFFINGRRLIGAQPFEKFQSLIDAELENAKALVAKGTPAKDVYARIMKTAKGPEPPEQKKLAPPSGPVAFRGSAGAKVLIQEIGDFQCQFCARAQPTIKEVLATYGGRVKIVFRHKPLSSLHPDAALAAEAALEAFTQKGSDGFWSMHDLLFENQSQPAGLKRDALEKYAAQIGLDVAAFRAALDSHVHQAQVDADSAAIDAVGITGTPAFVINGYFISGAQGFTKFRKLIDLALAEAK
jgi:protein-disulfide isomerase